jgi:hypothetical protein
MIMAILAPRERETIAGQKPSSAPAARRVVRPQSEPDANARLKGATAVHPAVIGIAMFAAFWFAFAAWVGFASDKEAAVVIVVVIFITAMFLGLLAGGGCYSRNMTAERRSTRSFRDFLNGSSRLKQGKFPDAKLSFRSQAGQCSWRSAARSCAPHGAAWAAKSWSNATRALTTEEQSNE